MEWDSLVAEAVRDASDDLASVPGAEAARAAGSTAGTNTTPGSTSSSSASSLAACLPRSELPERPAHWQRMRIPWARRERAQMRLITAALSSRLNAHSTASVNDLPASERQAAVADAVLTERRAYLRATQNVRTEKAKSDFFDLVSAAEQRLKQPPSASDVQPSSSNPDLHSSTSGANSSAEEQQQQGQGGCNKRPVVSVVDDRPELLDKARVVRSDRAQTLLAQAAEHRATVGALWSPYLPKPDGVEWGSVPVPLPYHYGGANDDEEDNGAYGSSTTDKRATGGTVAHRTTVQKKVTAFVEGCLKPFSDASLLDNRQTEEVKKRCVAKVMKKHEADTSAEFLTREGEKVRQLVSEQVKRTRDGLRR